MPLATPRTWVVGEFVTAAYMNAEIRDQFTDLIATWVAYVPAWTASSTNPAISNGTLTGRSKLVGKTCTAIVEMVAGTTTTFGTGTWQFSLPYTAANPAGTSANFVYCGAARAHSATAWFTGTTAVIKNQSTMKVFSHSASQEWSPSQPHSWTAATTNYLHAQITYETA
ncbi:hypothetical protein J7E93_02590 [Streptomyces sp. ISL-36]|uniref:hypothetical protein n=1 Tax=Streptomyces sp. ISL-36 TaxID=2819182 RepID=UPI001BE52AD6|nr:hypothetical protein [Streptomyces sp. ISL-36]MBT2439025.1 hypothetical protein [Streptomyces sp. ISL-36]